MQRAPGNRCAPSTHDTTPCQTTTHHANTIASATAGAEGEAVAIATTSEATQAASGATDPEVPDRTVTADGTEAVTARGRHFEETSEAATAGTVTEAGATAATVGATIVALLQAQGLAQATAAHPRPRQDRLP